MKALWSKLGLQPNTCDNVLQLEIKEEGEDWKEVETSRKARRTKRYVEWKVKSIVPCKE